MSNIIPFIRPIEIAIARLDSVLDEMLDSDKYDDVQSRMLWFEIHTAKHLLEKELGLINETEKSGLKVIGPVAKE